MEKQEKQDYIKTLDKKYLQELYNESGSVKNMLPFLKIGKSKLLGLLNQLKVDYIKNIKPYNLNHDFFSKINYSPDVFYIAGFIAADGCLLERHTNSKILQICLARQDEDILIKIKNKIEAENKICYYEVKPSKNNKIKDSKKCCSLRISSKKIFNDLAAFNIVPRKTEIYDMPEWLIDHQFVRHFIRGYNDGDGGFYKSINKNRKKKTPQYICAIKGNYNFLCKIQYILEINCNLSKNPRNVRKSDSQYVLSIGGNKNVTEICNYLYSDSSIHLERKYYKINHLLNNQL